MIDPSRAKAKAILAEIVRQSDGRFDGKTRLYKAFVFAHLFYFRDNTGLLSDWPIVHMPNGPGVDCGDQLLREMAATGLLTIVEGCCGPYPEWSYKLASDAVPAELDEAEAEAVRKAVDFVRDKTATQLSELFHEHSRTWCAGTAGKPLNVYLDIIDSAKIDRTRLQLAQISEDVAEVFCG